MHPRFIGIVISLLAATGFALSGCGGDSSPASTEVEEVSFNDVPEEEDPDVPREEHEDPGETPVESDPTVTKATPLAAPAVHAGQQVMGSNALTLTGRVWSTPVRAQGSTYVLTGGI